MAPPTVRRKTPATVVASEATSTRSPVLARGTALVIVDMLIPSMQERQSTIVPIRDRRGGRPIRAGGEEPRSADLHAPGERRVADPLLGAVQRLRRVKNSSMFTYLTGELAVADGAVADEAGEDAR